MNAGVYSLRMKGHIEFIKVTKTYNTSKAKYSLLRDVIGDNLLGVFRGVKKGNNQIRALNRVSFTIKGGEAIGIIGRNGAGKSTILKLISKITYPETGKVIASGRIGAFIELGAGLHHELTGRENIFIYGSIMGMKRKEIKERFDDIVDFAGIKKFIDLPIKKYSSGMYSRLGFSVCAFCNPDILLVDEVLAVGDVNFQKKCIDKMKQFKKENRTIVFVSHDMNAIVSFCDRVIYLEAGRVAKIGKPDKIINYYLAKSKEE